MTNISTQLRVRAWRERNKDLNKERNRKYSKTHYIWKTISAEFRKFDPIIFQ